MRINSSEWGSCMDFVVSDLGLRQVVEIFRFAISAWAVLLQAFTLFEGPRCLDTEPHLKRCNPDWADDDYNPKL